MEEKKFICAVRLGKQRKIRYLSSCSFVNDDIVIHFSDKPVPVAHKLARIISDLLPVCDGPFESWETRVQSYASVVEVPGNE